MINKQKIKKLAFIAADSKAIPVDIEKFVLTRLGKSELKAFLAFYKAALSKKRVYVTSAEELSSESVKMIKSIYNDKEIIEIKDESLGAGLKLVNDDMVIDFTFKKYINDTIVKLKN